MSKADKSRLVQPGRASAALWQGVFSHSPDSILVVAVGPHGMLRLETFNPAAAQALGLQGDAAGRPLVSVLPSYVAALATAEVEHCRVSRRVIELADVALLGGGRRSWDVTLSPIVDGAGRVRRIVITARETTEKRLAADLLRDNHERYRLIADNVADLVIRLDRDHVCGFVSPASRELIGYEPEELIARAFVDFVHAEERADFAAGMRDLGAGETREIRFRLRHGGGAFIWAEATTRQLPGSQSHIMVVRDISRRKQIEDELAAANRQLRVMAMQDGLTGLPNRRTFNEVLEREWRRATRAQAPLGLLMLDVDYFKRFNDLYGHQAGDETLCAVARAIAAALHRPGDFAARYGGEEFVVVLPGTDATGAVEVAERIRQNVLAAGIVHRGNPAHVVTVSIGAWGSGDGATADSRVALQRADASLYAAKAAGRNCVMHARERVAEAV